MPYLPAGILAQELSQTGGKGAAHLETLRRLSSALLGEAALPRENTMANIYLKRSRVNARRQLKVLVARKDS